MDTSNLITDMTGSVHSTNVGTVLSADTLTSKLWAMAPDPIGTPNYVPIHIGEEAQPRMRGLYEVFIVEPDTGKVSGPYLVLSSFETTARLKALRLVDMPGDLDDYDIIVRRLGDVRPKRQPTEVRIAK